MNTIFEGAVSNIEMALCITSAKIAVQTMGRFFDKVSLVKIIFVYTLIVNFLSSTLLSSSPRGAIVRQISVIGLANSLLNLVSNSVSQDEIAEFYRESDLMPWHVTSESFVKSCLVAIGIVWLAKSLQRVKEFSIFTPELERIAYATQYMFADAILPLILVLRIERLTALLGFIGIQLLSIKDTDSDRFGESAYSIFIKGLTMAWVSLLVKLLIPSDQYQYSEYVSIVTALMLAVFLAVICRHVKVLQNIISYVEWSIANTVREVFSKLLYQYTDILVVSAVVSVFCAMQLGSNEKGNHFYDPVLITLLHVFSIIFSSTLSSVIMNVFGQRSAIDILVALFSAVEIIRVIIFFIRSRFTSKRS